MTPVRKTIEETCPSPVARRLMMIRTAPAGMLRWLRCGTIDGLKSAADSIEYSAVK